MPDTYDHITLMCRLKAAQRRNKELESGERYIQLEELHQKILIHCKIFLYQYKPQRSIA